MTRNRHTATFWLFLAPVLVAFVMIVLIPFCIGVYYSFTDWNATARAGQGISFVGLANYRSSFRDPGFLYSFLITTIYTVVNVAFINTLAVVLALAVTSKLKLRTVYRMGFFMPYLIGGLILGYLWQFIFNNALPAAGRIVPFLGALARPENLLLGEVPSSILALVIVGSWQYAGYIMMIYVAAIEAVPGELHEAATLDGASEWQRFRTITVPMIAQAFTVTMFLTMVNSFKQFDVNYSLTAGGPATTFMGRSIFGTELLAMNIYNTAFVGNNLAAGQARAVIFFIVIVAFSIFQVRINKRKELEL
ncbi:carbohydrate ABC transporter membrane protein 1, CUT1 family [Alkalispirochaeta americana]|uniref:Carbohydrate ABC transporter membrane protein 1, CUT1 family n=1 Tax=Alkalispirochaeta americana TaxID=159291 RepID=A0A1N6SKU5_9SPIO|nr:sugar ABC transporter permease [Alkalispirochaeta americana]SIQ41592.1 carbohydrate ABC transporter membrane protein 1, CUT1 family [Alkalispirochaeta americana]